MVAGGHRLLDRVFRHVCQEAYEQPEVVRSAPHHQVTHRIDGSRLDDADGWATTWRAYQRKRGGVAALS